MRSVARWLHFILAIPIFGYIYSPFDKLPQYAPPTRYIFFPLMVITGLWMWKGHLVRRTLHERNGLTPMKSPINPNNEASAKISQRIEDLGDWRGATLAHLRKLIHDADPDVEEEWKWEKPTSGGVPVFSHDGIICTGEAYKQVVKLTFARGAAIQDPSRLFNSSLDGNVRRAIDVREGEKIDEAAFKKLILAAVEANAAALAERAAKKKK